MVYMGSKNKYSKYIVPIIQQYIDQHGIQYFIDCFCGGANLADKINCKNIICNDLSPTLIALHQQAQHNFSLIPKTGDKEYWNNAYAQWKQLKKNLDNQQELTKGVQLPLYIIGAIEWYGSFSRGGFKKGYANPTQKRDYYREGRNNHFKQAQGEIYKKINFISGDYRDLSKNVLQDLPHDKVLLYCDAPYKGTAPYGIALDFNFEEYYNWLQSMSKNFPIFISESNLPQEFDKYLIWEMEVNRTVSLSNKCKSTEKLFLMNQRNEYNISD